MCLTFYALMLHVKSFPSECVFDSRGPCFLSELTWKSEQDFQCFTFESLSQSKTVDWGYSFAKRFEERNWGEKKKEGPVVTWKQRGAIGDDFNDLSS